MKKKFFNDSETEEVSTETTVEVETVKPNLTRFMLGTYVDPTTGDLMFAQAKFDPITKVVGEVATERVAGNEEVMRERLVIKQAQLSFFTPSQVANEVKIEEMY